MHQKLAPDPFSILLNNSKRTLHAGNSFENKFLKDYYLKALKKSTLTFFSNRVPLMDKVIKNKKSLELVTSSSSGYETSSEKFLYSLLSDQV